MQSIDFTSFRELTNHIFLNAPYSRLVPGDLLDFFLEHRLQPEIGLEGDCLWKEDRSSFEHLAVLLESQGLSCTLHAPFHDLTPGGFDPKFVELTREKLHRAFELLSIFRPKSIVCHLGFDACKHAGKLERWLDVATETWCELLHIAQEENVQVMFENTYETDPSVHRALFSRLEEYSPRFCLDTGHVLCFSSTPWQQWLAEMEPWLGQLHIHDNDTTTDAHLPPGKGSFDFSGLFSKLTTSDETLLCTLEQRTPQDMYASLDYLTKLQIRSLLSPWRG